MVTHCSRSPKRSPHKRRRKTHSLLSRGRPKSVINAISTLTFERPGKVRDKCTIFKSSDLRAKCDGQRFLLSV
jgi:hypothetical protein